MKIAVVEWPLASPTLMGKILTLLGVKSQTIPAT